ncbi:hypothetical protein BDR05DRAFT_956623 [Suillus weaverae]|nr:hypothetical protein BDR05DRAFT_956623 [Suillus weaverae]
MRSTSDSYLPVTTHTITVRDSVVTMVQVVARSTSHASSRQRVMIAVAFAGTDILIVALKYFRLHGLRSCSF